MKTSKALAVLFLSWALSGCGTVATAFCDTCGKLEPYSGTRLMANGHATQLDVPFSFALDTVLLPLTIPKTIVDKFTSPETAAEAKTAPQQAAPPKAPSIGITRLAPPPNAYVLAPVPAVALATAGDHVAVYLVPLDDFSSEDAARLARMLADDLRLNVKVSPPMASTATTPLRGEDQYSVDEILAETRTTGRRLVDASNNVVLIALTQRDINDSMPGLNFLFSKHDLSNRVSVISTARMMPGTEEARDRLYKMTKRTIGEQYFGMKRSTDRRDIMYAPILSLHDVDAMGKEFLRGTVR